MTKYLLLLIISMSTIPSCSSLDRQTPIHKNIDKDLVSYVEDFAFRAPIKHLASWKKYKLTVGFKDLPGKTTGVCYSWEVSSQGTSYREISIDKKDWDRYSYIQKKALIFHELTHCLCNRDHDFSGGKYPQKEYFWTPKNNGYFKDGCPTSFMHPTLQEDDCLETHWNHYAVEMWERCSP